MSGYFEQFVSVRFSTADKNGNKSTATAPVPLIFHKLNSCNAPLQSKLGMCDVPISNLHYPDMQCFLLVQRTSENSIGQSCAHACIEAFRSGAAVLCAFDLIELDGEDLRTVPIEQRKGLLGNLVRVVHYGITLNEHYEGDGATIYRHPVALVARASYRNGSAHAIALAALTTGLRSRIRRRQQT